MAHSYSKKKERNVDCSPETMTVTTVSTAIV